MEAPPRPCAPYEGATGRHLIPPLAPHCSPAGDHASPILVRVCRALPAFVDGSYLLKPIYTKN